MTVLASVIELQTLQAVVRKWAAPDVPVHVIAHERHVLGDAVCRYGLFRLINAPLSSSEFRSTDLLE